MTSTTSAPSQVPRTDGAPIDWADDSLQARLDALRARCCTVNG
jgi:hypothetical protein